MFSVKTLRDAGQCGSTGGRLLAEAPHLEAFAVYRFFDGGAGELVRRCPVSSNDAGHRPRTMLGREFAAARVTRKGPQFSPALGFENINSHGSPFMQWPRSTGEARHPRVIWAVGLCRSESP